MQERRATPVFRYSAAIASVVASTILRVILDPVLGIRFPFATIFFAVLFSAWFGGFGPALLASVLGGFASAWYLLPPRGTFFVESAHDQIGLLLYAAVSIGIALIGGNMRRTQMRAQSAAASLAAQREQLRVTLESIGDAVITTDTDGRLTSINRVAAELTGWNPAEAAGTLVDEVFRIINEATGKPAQNPIARVLREGRVVGLANHTVLIARDGSRRPIDDSAAPILDRSGSIIGTVLVFRDVTETRRAEEVRALLAAVVASSEDAIVTKTLDEVITSWNIGAERLYGYSAAEAIGQPITLIIPPDRQAEEHDIMQRWRSGERVEHFETVRLTKDGRRVEISLTVSPVHDAHGRIIGISKVARDITARKENERNLRESEERFRALTTNAPAAIFIKDLEGRYTLANPLACEALGRPESVVGFTDHDLLPAAVADDLRRRDREVIAAGHAIESEEVVRRPGYDRRFLSVKFPLFGVGGPVGVCGVAIDITERKRAEEAVRAADQRKDVFLVTLAHELRNPLAPLRNSIEIMKRADGDATLLARAQTTMDRQMSHLARLVDDLVDIARISRDQIELRRERVDLGSIIDHAVETCRPLAEARQLELKVATPSERIDLDADPVRLAQVFSNLLNNACKYTQPGGRVEIAARREGSHAVVAVRDNGVGIPPEMLSTIFDMFMQLGQPRGEVRSGLGIGLTLAQRLVEMHGGTIEAHSEGSGRGSEFVVRIPALTHSVAPPAPTPAAPAPHVVPRRILVVDDNVDAAESLAILLRLSGHEVELARDGMEGFAAAARLRPDVVLLDIGLPRMDGYEVAQRIRREEWGRDILLVALTGWGREEDRRKSSDVGFDHHLVKPVEPAVLMRCLER